MSPRVLAPLCLVLFACATGEDTAPDVQTTASMPTTVPPVGDAGTAGTTTAPTTGEPEATSTSTLPPDPSTTTAASTTTTSTTTAPVDATSTSTTAPSDDTTTAPPADTGEDCGPCDQPPGPCWASPGACVDGACDYAPSADGSACDDGDACTDSDACNGAGSCTGTKLECTPPPHATGGACQNGTCGGFTCVAPYADCDGSMDNGCEVPVGVPNQCDLGGLNPNNGCWTAYCGASGDADATNFGTYHCIDCANCHEPGAGTWQWCNHSSGNWYDAAQGGPCGASKDLVCKAG